MDAASSCWECAYNCAVGVESSSFQYGLFDYGCIEYEILTGDGRVIKATNQTNDPFNELFCGISGSFGKLTCDSSQTKGSLGVILSVKMHLIPAKQFVKLEYVTFTSLEAALKGTAECFYHWQYPELVSLCEKPRHDFLDGIAFNEHLIVLMIGTMVDSIPQASRATKFSHWWAPWFHKHCFNKISSSKNRTKQLIDYIPTLDYLFRYDRYQLCFPKSNLQQRRLLDCWLQGSST